MYMAKKIVIIGGSFGGLTTAFELKRLLGKTAEMTVLCDISEFIFIPSLPWLAMGWRTAEDITLPIEGLLVSRGISFVRTTAEYVDPDKSLVKTDRGEFPYDYLVISTGPHLAFDEIPGFGPEQGNTESIFTLEQAQRAKGAWDRFLEAPGPIAVGSVQGVSCSGPPYEYAFEVDMELRRRKMRHKVPMFFITSEPYVGHFGIGGLGASKRWMDDEFANRDIKVLTNQAVEEFIKDELRLKDGTRIPFKLAMFAPAMKGVPAVAHLGNPRGFIPVDDLMRHKKYRNIFTIGVAVAIAPPEQTPIPTGVPKTGFMAVRMAKTAAKAIEADIKGSSMPAPYEMEVMCLMDMGNTAALMKAKPLLPPRQEMILKKALWVKWLKIYFEKYFLWKIRHGYSKLP
jgi:sulfide:quinone oxidoreductase